MRWGTENLVLALLRGRNFGLGWWREATEVSWDI